MFVDAKFWLLIVDLESILEKHLPIIKCLKPLYDKEGQFDVSLVNVLPNL